MAMADSNEKMLLEKVLEKLAHLEILIRNGGKESPIVEKAPLWSDSECDSFCDVTETPVPKRRRVTIGQMRVHPGVAAYFEAHKNIDPEDFEGTIPDDYLTTPTSVRIRKRHQHKPKLIWDPNLLPGMSRPALLMVARDLGIFGMCKEISTLVLPRLESTKWLQSACISVSEGKGLPDFLAAPNTEAANRAAKKKSGGAKKVPKTTVEPTAPKKASKKKASKKAPKKASKKKASKKKKA